MIATAIAVNTNGGVILSAGATYGILLAILFSHGIVCSAATSILARLNLFYVVINSKFYYKSILRPHLTVILVGTTIAAIVSLLVCSGNHKVSTKDAFTLVENHSGWTNSMCKFIPGYDNFNLCVDGWAFLLSFTSPMWTLTGCKSR